MAEVCKSVTVHCFNGREASERKLRIQLGKTEREREREHQNVVQYLWPQQQEFRKTNSSTGYTMGGRGGPKTQNALVNDSKCHVIRDSIKGER
jgi:hypothetical protein